MSPELFARIADSLVAQHMTDARAAKAKGRSSVVAFYVRKARQARRDARRGAIPAAWTMYV